MKPSKPTDFRKHLEPLARVHDTRRVFDAFVTLAACALAVETREAEYLETIRHWQREHLDLFAQALGALILEMEANPFVDVLGGYYMEFALSSKGQQWNGEFHTPATICDLMASLTLGDLDQLPHDRPITVLEPACGAGAMILALAKAVPAEDRSRLRVTAIDINKTACDMCFINTTLWGIPTRVLHGNTLSMEFWHAWSNFPLMSSRACRTAVDQPTQQGQPPCCIELEQIKVSLPQHQQQELVLV